MKQQAQQLIACLTKHLEKQQKTMNNLILLILEKIQTIHLKIQLHLRKRRLKKQLARVRAMFNQNLNNQSSQKSTSIQKSQPLSNLAISRKKTKATGVNFKKLQVNTSSKPPKQKFSVSDSPKQSKEKKSRKTTKNSKSSAQSSTSKTIQNSKANTKHRSKVPKKVYMEF